MKIKKGDNIIVIAGKDKGKVGKVAKAFPKENKVLIEGINMHKKHQKPSRSGGKGQIIELALPIHVSNVMISEDGKRVRLGSKKLADKTIRVSKKTKKEI